MTDFNKAEFTKNIGKDGMQCYDNDLKFMGAHEICKMVLQDKLNSDMPEMQQYIDGLFLQLKPDMTSEVKGNAVTCMSKICTKLNSSQIEKIVKELIRQITSTDKELEDVRDVFVMCIKNIISEVPHDFHEKLVVVITEAHKGITSARYNKSFKNEQELIEIITLMFKRWGNIYEGEKFKELINLLKQNVINNNVDENLRKKSCISIGAVAVVLNKEEVNKLVQELIIQHTSIKNAQENQQKLKAISSTLNSLAKSVPLKMEGQIPSLVSLLKQEFNKWGLQEDTDDFDFVSVVCELYESYLSIIENLVKGCSVSCFDTTMKQDLILLSVELLTMDPNCNCTIEDDEDEEMGSDEDEEDSDNDYMDSDVDQDDQSWRVRRSAILLVEKIILTDKHMLDCIYHNMIAKTVEPKKNIIKRLREKNEQVRTTIIQVLTSFINQIMVSDHHHPGTSQFDHEEDFGFSEELSLKRVISKLTQFDLQDVIEPIKEEVTKIYQEKKSNTQIKIQAFRLIENLSNSVGKQILEREVTWSTIFTLLSNILKEKQVESEIKVSCLISLKKILKYRGQNDLRHIQNDLITIFDIVADLINSEQFKINAESLRLTSGIFRIIKKCFSGQISLYTAQINRLLPSIIRILGQADVDQEIKHAVISVASGILIHIGSTIDVAQLGTIFQHLNHKVTNENKNRIIILKLYKRIPVELSEKLNQECQKHLNTTIQTLCKFLNKEDRSERIATLEALNKLAQILGNSVDSAIQKQVIDSSLHMIRPKETKDIDPFLASIALSIYKQFMLINPNPCDQYNKILEGCLYLAGSTIFQANRYDILYEVFAIMAELKLIQIEPTINTLLARPSHDAIHSTAKAIAALTLVSGQKNKIIENIANTYALKHHGKDEDVALAQRQTALLTLSEIGKKENLTNNSAIFNGILELIQNKNEDLDKIRKYASIAFGGISLQNLNLALPKVIELINQHKNSYLMLNTLKEIIQNSQKIQDQQLGAIVDFLLKQASTKQDNKEQDLRNIVSECIGKLGVYNLDYLKDKLLQGLKSDNENLRYSIASSYKFFFNQQGKQNTTQELLHTLSQALINSVQDPSIQTREAVVKSLSSIAFNLPHIIEDQVNHQFFDHLKPSFDYYEVIETDLGAFKDKRDKGAPLRTAAFQFLQTSFGFRYVCEFYDGVIQACIGTIAKESEADIKFSRVQIILKFAEIAPQKVTPICVKIRDAMVSVMKVYAGSKPIPDSAMDLVRLCCKVLHTVDINMVNKNPDFNTFLEKLKKQDNEKFGKIFQSFAFN